MGRTTAADKKKMLLKIYHTKKEPFNLKELTKLAKAAGLAEKLVQDVNTQLMDDNYVSSDKIGTGNYFWAFPGSQGAQAKKQLEQACSTRSAGEPPRRWRGAHAIDPVAATLATGQGGRAQDRLAKAKVAEQEAKSGREDTDGSRAAKLKKLADLKTRRGQLEQRLDAYKANDPEELARIEKLSEDMKQHAIRWTENLFSVKDYLVQKKGVASYQIDELFKSVARRRLGQPVGRPGPCLSPPYVVGREAYTGRASCGGTPRSCRSRGRWPSLGSVGSASRGRPRHRAHRELQFLGRLGGHSRPSSTAWAGSSQIREAQRQIAWRSTIGP